MAVKDMPINIEKCSNIDDKPVPHISMWLSKKIKLELQQSIDFTRSIE